MKELDKQLIVIQEDELVEFDPFTWTAVIGTGYAISSLAFLLTAANEFQRALKIDKKWSERINLVDNKKDYWKVHIYPDPHNPNAFALGMGRHIFITSALIKFLNEREIEAVMLHEVYHNKNKDTYKDLAYKHGFFYLTTFLALSSSSIILGILVFLFMMKARNISHILLMGRKQELNADKYAVKLGYKYDLISAFEKMDAVTDRLYRKQPCGKWCQIEEKLSDMIEEHPSTKVRVEAILKSAEKFKGKRFTKIKDLIARSFKQNG